jgi:DHA1 family multidrug resistance protein-like MFS transporter
MVLVQAISACAFSISLPFLPLFIEQLGVHPLSNVELWSGIVGSINFIMAAIFAPIWGNLADRYGRKAMVVRSSIFGSLTSFAMGASPNVFVLTGARAVMGMFGGFQSAATALVASQVPSTMLGFALGWMATAQMAGTLIGPLIGGAIADVVHNYRAVYFYTAAGTMLAALVALAFVPEEFVKPEKTARVRGAGRKRFREILLHPELAPLLVVLMLAQVTALAVQPVVPLFIQSMVGATSPLLATFAGAAFAVVGIGDLIASPYLGKRSDRIGYRRTVLICLAGAAAFTIPQAFVHNIWGFLSLRFCVGLFLGGIIPTANAWIGRLFPAESRGLVYGLSYSASFGGMFLGPICGGILAARFGFGSVFLVTGTLMLGNLVWVWLGVRSNTFAHDWS